MNQKKNSMSLVEYHIACGCYDPGQLCAYRGNFGRFSVTTCRSKILRIEQGGLCIIVRNRVIEPITSIACCVMLDTKSLQLFCCDHGRLPSFLGDDANDKMIKDFFAVKMEEE